jgi:hypothetical protein
MDLRVESPPFVASGSLLDPHQARPRRLNAFHKSGEKQPSLWTTEPYEAAWRRPIVVRLPHRSGPHRLASRHWRVLQGPPAADELATLASLLCRPELIYNAIDAFTLKGPECHA